MAIGCIQAQKCHTDECPAGVATQNAWLTRGLDPESKSVRCGNYIKSLRRDLLKASEAIGVAHPGLISVDDVDLVDESRRTVTLRDVFGYDPAWPRLSSYLGDEITRIMVGNLPAPERVPHR